MRTAHRTFGHDDQSTFHAQCSAPHSSAHKLYSSSKLSLSMSKVDRTETRESNEPLSSTKRFSGTTSSHGKSNPFNSVNTTNSPAVASPTTAGASSAFGLGSGAFASFGGGAKTPKTPGTAFDFSRTGQQDRKEQISDRDDRDSKKPGIRKTQSTLRQAASGGSLRSESTPASVSALESSWPLKHGWVMHYRPPTGKHSDYEKSIMPICKVDTAPGFWTVYSHLKRPSSLPTVSDYHFFKEGIRPVWEDEENRRGGKWTMRVKKGVADRYWEDLLLAMIGEQFAEASDEVCGAVVSVRSGEDVFSIWTKNDGGRNIKIRETIKRVLSLPADTNLAFRSHDESITQRHAADQARQEKAAHQAGNDKRKAATNEGQRKVFEEARS